MKKLIGMVLALALLMTAAFAIAEEAQGTAMYVYTQDGKGLNVRSSMSTSENNIVGSLAYGTRVFTYGSPQPGWVMIDYGRSEGPSYVMSRFLVKNKPAPFTPSGDPAADPNSFDTRAATTVDQINTLLKSVKTVTPYTVTVRPTRSSGWVYMRWLPTRNSDQAAVFGANQELTVLAELKDWYQVQDPSSGKIGFVYKSYIQ